MLKNILLGIVSFAISYISILAIYDYLVDIQSSPQTLPLFFLGVVFSTIVLFALGRKIFKKKAQKAKDEEAVVAPPPSKLTEEVLVAAPPQKERVEISEPKPPTPQAPPAYLPMQEAPPKPEVLELPAAPPTITQTPAEPQPLPPAPTSPVPQVQNSQPHNLSFLHESTDVDHPTSFPASINKPGETAL